MYSGWVGLPTVRGSATSGYVQANRSHVRASDVRRKIQQNTATSSSSATAATDDKRSVGRNHITQQRRSATRILSKQEQDRFQRRQVENELLELRERLEGGGILTPEQIDVRIQREREMLLQRLQQSKSETEDPPGMKKIPHQQEECPNPEEPLIISPPDQVALLPLTTDIALLGSGRPNTFQQQAKIDPKFSDVRQEDRRRHPQRQSAAATSYPMGRSKPLLHSSHTTKTFLKERENDKIRNAFGIPKDLEGSAYDRERKRKAQLMEARAEAERQKLLEQQQEEEIEKNLQKAARRRMKETGKTTSSNSSSSSSSQISVTSTTSTSTSSTSQPRERSGRKRNSSRKRPSSRNSISSQSSSSSSSFSSSRSSSSRSSTSTSSRSSFSSRSSSSDQSHSTSVSSKGHRHLSSDSSNAQSSDRRSPESSQNSSKPKLQPNNTLRRKRMSSSSIPRSIETSSHNSSESSSYPPRTRKRSKSRKSAQSDESSH